MPFGLAPAGAGVEQLAKHGIKITGLEDGHQGVEMKAKARLDANAGPMPPTVANGAPMFGAAAPAAATPAAAPAAPAAAPRMAAAPQFQFGGAPGAVNPLDRGARAGASSSLGGPVAVGRSRYDPTRMAERMVRRGDGRGAQFIFGQHMQERGQDFQREMFGAQTAEAVARDANNFAQQQQMFGMQQDANAARDATNFEQGKIMFGMQNDASKAEYDRRRGDEISDRAGRGIESVGTMPVEGGFVPIVRRKDGGVDMAGGFMPGPKAAPQPGMMQLPGTNDFVPMFGNNQVSGAPIYTQKPTLTPLPDGQAGPPTPGTTLTAKPKDAKADKPIISWGEDPETPLRIPFQQITDPQTGEVILKKVKIVDADKNGVDDRLEQGAAPGGTPPPGAARTTPGGHSVKRVK